MLGVNNIITLLPCATIAFDVEIKLEKHHFSIVQAQLGNPIKCTRVPYRYLKKGNRNIENNVLYIFYNFIQSSLLLTATRQNFKLPKMTKTHKDIIHAQ